MQRVRLARLVPVCGHHLANKARKNYLCSRKCSKINVQPFPQQIVQRNRLILWFSFLCNHLRLQSVLWRIYMSMCVSILICHCLQTFRKYFCLMQALHLCVKAWHCLVLSILLYYLHFLFYSKSHSVFFSPFFQHSNQFWFFVSQTKSTVSLYPLPDTTSMLPTLNNPISSKPGFAAVF